MFNFKANIVKRRKFSKSAFLVGLIAAAALGYTSLTYLEQGLVPYVEMIIDQIGLNAYTSWVYIAIFSLLLLLLIPAIRTIFQKKVIIGGSVAFDEDKLEIKKGRQHLVIPEKELNQLNFELKKLPTKKKKANGKNYGGSFMKIPTTKGIFECELDLNDTRERDQLLEMIEFLKIEHDVKVNLKEIK